jgi:hypothetical protein
MDKLDDFQESLSQLNLIELKLLLLFTEYLDERQDHGLKESLPSVQQVPPQDSLILNFGSSLTLGSRQAEPHPL